MELTRHPNNKPLETFHFKIIHDIMNTVMVNQINVFTYKTKLTHLKKLKTLSGAEGKTNISLQTLIFYCFKAYKAKNLVELVAG